MNTQYPALILACVLSIFVTGCRQKAESPSVIEPGRQLTSTISQLPPLLKMSATSGKAIPKKQRLLFERAQRDLDFIFAGGTPTTCKSAEVILDGGTKTYGFDDYQIVEWRQLLTINGVNFQKRGISIQFNTDFHDASAAYVWLEPVFL